MITNKLGVVIEVGDTCKTSWQHHPNKLWIVEKFNNDNTKVMLRTRRTKRFHWDAVDNIAWVRNMNPKVALIGEVK